MTRFLLTLDSAVDLISWAYETPEAHGCIAIPKVQSFKIEHIAKALIKEYKGDSNAMQLNVVGIRKGEKLHEEMISVFDSPNTIDIGKYYLILPNNLIIFPPTGLACSFKILININIFNSICG